MVETNLPVFLVDPEWADTAVSQDGKIKVSIRGLARVTYEEGGRTVYGHSEHCGYGTGTPAIQVWKRTITDWMLNDGSLCPLQEMERKKIIDAIEHAFDSMRLRVLWVD